MTREQLIKDLRELQLNNDEEFAHTVADDLLLKFINDEEISAAFDGIDKWYA